MLLKPRWKGYPSIKQQEIIGYPADESYFDYSIAMSWTIDVAKIRHFAGWHGLAHIPFHNRNSSQDSLPNYFLISNSSSPTAVISNSLSVSSSWPKCFLFHSNISNESSPVSFGENVRNFRAYLAPSPASMASSSFLYLSWKLELPAMFSRQLGWCMKCQKYPTKLQEKGWKRCPTIFSHALLSPWKCHVANSNRTDIQDKLRSLSTQVS